MQNEIEVRFLEINKDELLEKLKVLGADDHGEVMLEEVIIYDPELTWLKEKRFIRLRKSGENITCTYKEHRAQAVDGAHEIEFNVTDLDKACDLFEKIGLPPFRRQQKKRHTLTLGDTTIDIDTWPNIPTYVELEGPSEETLRTVAKNLGFDWGKEAVFDDAKMVIEGRYGIPVGTLRWFTFDRIE
ncbi:MAG: hypothetical protein A2937_02435 [Candidatus Yonathbacteria bacterium RIFCSPLOWO2_01_FULL_47_33b]|uniref:CYTH domain-containing protein n=1 Tax=Candidatus Yonathbacteria bacterium RIFCSPLOWO2_01_FULL_47_33b TaxID=1802727 RepID=A0A1G2SG30_9BACT|nr:MAG: hypothetical protein A2937_02435 [Candidatus Yonathbacteria bacterium RIFCSPLOWO2_01_FULL_47_33b]